MDGVSVIKCFCGSELFTNVYRILEVSKLVSKTGQTEFAPNPVFICMRCNKELDLAAEVNRGEKLIV